MIRTPELGIVAWRKSSDTPELGIVAWRKSSYSDGGDGNCIEVADGFQGVVPVRDSKRPYGPVLAVPAASWSAFVRAVRRDEFDAL